MKWLGGSDLMILLLQFWFLEYFDEMFGVVMALCWLGFCELQVPTDAYEPEVRNFKKGFVSENSCCLIWFIIIFLLVRLAGTSISACSSSYFHFFPVKLQSGGMLHPISRYTPKKGLEWLSGLGSGKGCWDVSPTIRCPAGRIPQCVYIYIFWLSWPAQDVLSSCSSWVVEVL